MKSLFSSSAASIGDKLPNPINSPKAAINDKNPSTSIASVSNNLKDKLSIDNRSPTRVTPKRRSISATTSNSITPISLDNNKNLREKRTSSASNIPLRTKTSLNKKRSYSPNSVSLSLPSKNFHQKKKQKISNYWILSGKSEQRLVSIYVSYLFF